MPSGLPRTTLGLALPILGSSRCSRQHRRTKTDANDGEALLRILMAFKRGEPRVCSMVVPPSVEVGDRRRLARERRTLIKERIGHINRMKGLLATQGITDYEPMRKNCRERLKMWIGMQ